MCWVCAHCSTLFEQKSTRSSSSFIVQVSRSDNWITTRLISHNPVCSTYGSQWNANCVDSTAFVQREVKSTVSCRVYAEAQNHFLLHFPNKDIFRFQATVVISFSRFFIWLLILPAWVAFIFHEKRLLWAFLLPLAWLECVSYQLY